MNMSKCLGKLIAAVCVIAPAIASAATLEAFKKIPEEVTLFKNVGVFNGVDNKLHDVDVLVVRNKIHKIAK
ncbi:MAG: hypothetical protein ACWA5Q_07450, partial [bacterium]